LRSLYEWHRPHTATSLSVRRSYVDHGSGLLPKQSGQVPVAGASSSVHIGSSEPESASESESETDSSPESEHSESPRDACSVLLVDGAGARAPILELAAPRACAPIG
jgi:hypothetical protein